jgi:hypothetical protein
MSVYFFREYQGNILCKFQSQNASFRQSERHPCLYFHKMLEYLLLIASGIAYWVSHTRNRRWDHYNAIHQKYGPKWDNGRGSITPEEAQEVLQLSDHYDMPLLMYHAHSFALFKTYAIVGFILICTLILNHFLPSLQSPNF